ncbi:hypothetical protein [Dyadobacter sp. CY347]|uniref:hypothetical protein n=1 Tax=Dyadobacter sp. CY347 TaxID=2909336 RepID=UPI001F454E0C|nr:hypothetical protein [Dyadobacter sp. CY347]MCF2487461.1 hypothetical protein [Dyadobacter sp. CY347]
MFYLNGTQINEPAGWSGVYWTRVRHPGYFGIWRHRTAKVMGVGEVGFDGEARYILQSLWKKYGVNASAIFEVREGGEVIYSAEIDFGIWKDNGRYFNVSFRDEDTELDSLSSMVVAIEPTVQIRLPQQTISAGIEYAIGEGLSRPARIDGSTHSVPFATSKSGEGNGLSASTLGAVEPIYRNSTDRKAILNLEGKVIGVWSGGGNFRLIAEVTQDGVLKDSRIISILSTSGFQQTSFISERIEIPQGAYLRLVVSGNNGLNVTYNADSFLTIFENSDSDSSLIWGLTFKQAIEGLLEKLTAGSVTLLSTYLSKGLGASRTLTSEMNVRGYRSKIQISFKSFFDDINVLDNLACWKRGNVLYIESKADMIGKVGRSRITDFETLEHSGSPYYYSSYNVGYNNWQSGTAAGRDEFCTQRTYQTRQLKMKASLSILASSISASGKTMEVLRRNPNSEKADTSQDEKLFVIEADKIGSIYIARTGSVENVISPESAINGGLSPRNILNRWMNMLAVNGTATFTSGTGNITARIDGISESADVAPDSVQIFSDRSVIIETGMTMRQYSQMGEVVEYFDHDGAAKAALIIEDSYRFSTGKASIKAIELQ